MNKTCRICLKLVEKYEVLSDLINDVLNVIFLDILNFDLTKNVIICIDCMEFLIAMFNFKTKCVYSEDALYPYFKDEKINIKEVPAFEKENCHDNYQICRFCSEMVTENYMKLIEHSDEDDAIRRFLPEISVFGVESPIICQNCQIAVHLIDEFLDCCQNTEIKIKRVYENLGKPFDLNDVNVDKLLFEIQHVQERDENVNSFLEENNDIKIEEHPLLDSKLEEPSPTQPEQLPIRYTNLKQCTHCEYTAKFESILKKHFLKHLDPSKTEMYSCFNCDFRTKYKSNLKIHIKTHLNASQTKIFKCAQCYYQCKYKQLLVNHIRSHKNEKDFKCNLCGKSYKHYSGLYTHTKKKHDDTYIGSNTHKKIKHKDATIGLDKHKIKHKDATNIGLGTYNEIKLKVATNNNFKCNICNAEFTEKYNLNRHLWCHSSQRRYKCDICSYTFKRSDHLNNHRLRHSDDSNTLFKCLLCPYASKRKDSVKTHMLVHNNIRTMTCSQCSYLTNSKSRLKQHMEVHELIKNYACDVCTFRTASRRILKKHKDVHLGIKHHHCDKCVYKTIRKDGLKRHKLLVHSSNTNPLTCSRCDFKCKQEKTLERHSHTHSSPQRTYACLKCSYETTVDKHYKKHMILHETRRFWHKCAKCSFESSSNMQLARHLLVHTEHRGFKCNFCDYVGKRRDTVIRHELVRHEKNVNETFECYCCGYVTKRKDCLADHIKKKHTRAVKRPAVKV